MRRVRPLVTLSLVGTLAAGCNAGQRAECDLLVGTANRRLDAIAQHDEAEGSDPGEAARKLDELARLYDELGRSVGGLTLTTPELARHAREYQQVAARAAAATRLLAGAVRQRDPAAQRSAEEDLARVTQEQQSLVEKVNAVCGK